jgi:ribosomal protein L44E
MTQATLRPTAAQIQQLQAKKDRKLAAQQRRLDRQAGVVTAADEIKALYNNVGA